MKVFGQPWCIMGRINETEIPSLIRNLNFLAVCEKNTKQIQRTHPHCSCTACLLAPILTHSFTQVRFESPGLARWPQPTGSDSTACFLDGNVFRLTHISYLETLTRNKKKKKNPTRNPIKRPEMRCFQRGCTCSGVSNQVPQGSVGLTECLSCRTYNHFHPEWKPSV